MPNLRSASTRGSRLARPALERLEGRLTPATFTYSGVTRTLTVVAAEGDRLSVAPLPNLPTGYLAVTEATHGTVFRSDAPAGRLVRHLIVRFDHTDRGELTVDASTRLGGSLSVVGARQSTHVTSGGTVGGNVTFTPTAAADDVFTLLGSTQVGGKVDLKLGGGADRVRLDGGFIGGDLTVRGDSGGDQVELLAAGDLRVSGGVTLDLGDGVNTVTARGAHLLDVGRRFTYQGNGGADTVALRHIDDATFDAALRVGRDAIFALDCTAAGGGVNRLALHRVTVGGSLSVTGGAATDTVEFAGPLTVGNDLRVHLLGGNNVLTVAGAAGQNRIGGMFRYVGGAGQDQVAARRHHRRRHRRRGPRQRPRHRHPAAPRPVLQGRDARRRHRLRCAHRAVRGGRRRHRRAESALRRPRHDPERPRRRRSCAHQRRERVRLHPDRPGRRRRHPGDRDQSDRRRRRPVGRHHVRRQGPRQRRAGRRHRAARQERRQQPASSSARVTLAGDDSAEHHSSGPRTPTSCGDRQRNHLRDRPGSPGVSSRRQRTSTRVTSTCGTALSSRSSAVRPNQR
ncbi:MAG: hypothetical protein U0736_16340 [Gemmataceae bacterium]